MDQEAVRMNNVPLGGSGAKSEFLSHRPMRRRLMKNVAWKLCLLAGFAGGMLFGNTTPVFAADEGPGGPDQRLQQMERRINELADRQEQMLRRLGAPPGAQDQRPGRFGAPQDQQPGRFGGPQEPGAGRFGGPRERQGPMPPPGPDNLRPPMPPRGPNPPEAAKVLRGLGDLMGLVLLVCILCNVLLAIWIFTDIRKRGEGSGIFIALALVAGIPAAIIYSLVRLGDKASVTGK
jgi:hypothetical protein